MSTNYIITQIHLKYNIIDPEIVVEEARQQGKVTKVIGAVTDSDDIRILNRGAYQKEEWVDFPVSVS